jgi:hypothetical protein
MRLYAAIHFQWVGRPEYSLIDTADNMTAKGNVVVRETVHDEDCRLILKGQYRARLYGQPPFTKIRPYTYSEYRPRLFQKMRPELCRVEKRLDRLYFRGAAHFGREAILPLLQDIVDPAEEYLSVEGYYREAAAARIGLSLPGGGNVCYREIEYFGMGVVALMPHPRNTFHEPLVPNVHYLAADVTPRCRGRRRDPGCLRAPPLRQGVAEFHPQQRPGVVREVCVAAQLCALDGAVARYRACYSVDIVNRAGSSVKKARPCQPAARVNRFLLDFSQIRQRRSDCHLDVLNNGQRSHSRTALRRNHETNSDRRHCVGRPNNAMAERY